MALITIDRSYVSDSEDTTCGEIHDVSLNLEGHFFGENYLAVRGAAVILSNVDGFKSNLPNNLSGSINGEIKDHLQLMIQLIRPQDFIKLAVRLEQRLANHSAYMTIVATGQVLTPTSQIPSPKYGQHTDEVLESLIIGVDIYEGKSMIGLVLPLRSDSKIELDGDGGFNIFTDGQFHNFKPISVQAMWSSLQYLIKEKELVNSREKPTGTEAFVYYQSRVSSQHAFILAWHANPDNICDIERAINEGPNCDVQLQKKVRHELKRIMMTVDLEEVTSKYLRTKLEDCLGVCLADMKRFIDDEMIIVMRQMESPSKILDFLYLGSEWNASNLDELLQNGIGYILNVTREIANFYPDSFEYKNIRIYDDEEADLLRHFEETHKFICRASAKGSKILVHCKMGISRSASTVIAFVMKELAMQYTDALKFVRERRNCIQPNKSFESQLKTYEGILGASKQRHNDLWRTTSLCNLNIPVNFEPCINDTSILDPSVKKSRKKVRCQSFLETTKKSINVFLKMDQEVNSKDFKPLMEGSSFQRTASYTKVEALINSPAPSPCLHISPFELPPRNSFRDNLNLFRKKSSPSPPPPTDTQISSSIDVYFDQPIHCDDPGSNSGKDNLLSKDPTPFPIAGLKTNSEESISKIEADEYSVLSKMVNKLNTGVVPSRCMNTLKLTVAENSAAEPIIPCKNNELVNDKVNDDSSNNISTHSHIIQPSVNSTNGTTPSAFKTKANTTSSAYKTRECAATYIYKTEDMCKNNENQPGIFSSSSNLTVACAPPFLTTQTMTGVCPKSSSNKLSELNIVLKHNMRSDVGEYICSDDKNSVCQLITTISNESESENFKKKEAKIFLNTIFSRLKSMPDENVDRGTENFIANRPVSLTEKPSSAQQNDHLNFVQEDIDSTPFHCLKAYDHDVFSCDLRNIVSNYKAWHLCDSTLQNNNLNKVLREDMEIELQDEEALLKSADGSENYLAKKEIVTHYFINSETICNNLEQSNMIGDNKIDVSMPTTLESTTEVQYALAKPFPLKCSANRARNIEPTKAEFVSKYGVLVPLDEMAKVKQLREIFSSSGGSDTKNKSQSAAGLTFMREKQANVDKTPPLRNNSISLNKTVDNFFATENSNVNDIKFETLPIDVDATVNANCSINSLNLDMPKSPQSNDKCSIDSLYLDAPKSAVDSSVDRTDINNSNEKLDYIFQSPSCNLRRTWSLQINPKRRISNRASKVCSVIKYFDNGTDSNRVNLKFETIDESNFMVASDLFIKNCEISSRCSADTMVKRHKSLSTTSQ